MKKLLDKTLLLTIALVISMAVLQNAIAQHEGHDMSKMPGMSKPKPKAKASAKRRVTKGKRKAANNRPLRILHLTAGSDAGGLSRYIYDLGTAMIAKGHAVSVAGQRGASGCHETR